MHDILIGILPVLGVMVGALLQHVLAKSKERNAQFATLRHAAYADFLKTVAAAAIKPSQDAVALVADAKARMAVYGSNAVIAKMAEFEATGANLANEQSKTAFVEVALKMRSEGHSNSANLNEGALSSLLFGKARK